MSWIAELDTHGMEFPTCVHVTKTTHTMTHGATYVPIEDGKAARDENARLRELVRIAVKYCDSGTCDGCPIQGESGSCPYSDMARELGIEVDA
jgi:hypothetical protein